MKTLIRCRPCRPPCQSSQSTMIQVMEAGPSGQMQISAHASFNTFNGVDRPWCLPLSETTQDLRLSISTTGILYYCTMVSLLHKYLIAVFRRMYLWTASFSSVDLHPEALTTKYTGDMLLRLRLLVIRPDSKHMHNSVLQRFSSGSFANV